MLGPVRNRLLTVWLQLAVSRARWTNIPPRVPLPVLAMTQVCRSQMSRSTACLLHPLHCLFVSCVSRMHSVVVCFQIRWLTVQLVSVRAKVAKLTLVGCESLHLRRCSHRLY